MPSSAKVSTSQGHTYRRGSTCERRIAAILKENSARMYTLSTACRYSSPVSFRIATMPSRPEPIRQMLPTYSRRSTVSSIRPHHGLSEWLKKRCSRAREKRRGLGPAPGCRRRRWHGKPSRVPHRGRSRVCSGIAPPGGHTGRSVVDAPPRGCRGGRACASKHEGVRYMHAGQWRQAAHEFAGDCSCFCSFFWTILLETFPILFREARGIAGRLPSVPCRSRRTGRRGARPCCGRIEGRSSSRPVYVCKLEPTSSSWSVRAISSIISCTAVLRQHTKPASSVLYFHTAILCQSYWNQRNERASE
jgi:hypothetical protein